MKQVLVIIDGVSDDPIPALGGKTPLESALIPHMHYLSTKGVNGRIRTAFDGFPVESMVCIMGLLGYPPDKYYPHGRASFEAMAKGIPLKKGDLILRCNIINVNNAGEIADFTAGQISDSDAKRIISRIRLPFDNWELYPGQSYRNTLIIRGANVDFKSICCAEPHMHIGQQAESLLPASSDRQTNMLMSEIGNFLQDSRNQIRDMRMSSECSGNMLWVWSPSQKPEWPSFYEVNGMKGACVGGLDFLHGIAMAADMHFDIIPGATGYIDTDYDAKARYAIECLKRYDFVLVHINATDEEAHMHNHFGKKRAIETIDQKIIGPLLMELHENYPEFRLAVCGDHKTRCSDGKHIGDPVPFILFDNSVTRTNHQTFSETDSFSHEPISSLDFLSDYLNPTHAAGE